MIEKIRKYQKNREDLVLMNVRLPKSQRNFIKQNNLNFSAIVKDAITIIVLVIIIFSIFFWFALGFDNITSNCMYECNSSIVSDCMNSCRR